MAVPRRSRPMRLRRSLHVIDVSSFAIYVGACEARRAPCPWERGDRVSFLVSYSWIVSAEGCV